MKSAALIKVSFVLANYNPRLTRGPPEFRKFLKKQLTLKVIISLYTIDLNIYNFHPKHTSIWWISNEIEDNCFFLLLWCTESVMISDFQACVICMIQEFEGQWGIWKNRWVFRKYIVLIGIHRCITINERSQRIWDVEETLYQAELPVLQHHLSHIYGTTLLKTEFHLNSIF
jgi:hypothetical protein